MDGGLVGRISEHSFTKFLMIIVLVWLAVALGIVLAGLLPQLPAGVRSIMAPTTQGGAAHPAGVPAV